MAPQLMQMVALLFPQLLRPLSVHAAPRRWPSCRGQAPAPGRGGSATGMSARALLPPEPPDALGWVSGISLLDQGLGWVTRMTLSGSRPLSAEPGALPTLHVYADTFLCLAAPGLAVPGLLVPPGHSAAGTGVGLFSVTPEGRPQVHRCPPAWCCAGHCLELPACTLTQPRGMVATVITSM